MHQQVSLPRARQDGLLVETVGEELLLYDQNSHTAHCLSPIAACVWRHCDGEHDLTDLAQLAGASENLVADALHELREKDLLDAEPQIMQSTIPGISRREAIGQVARYGAAATAVPLIVSATAATPAMASSEELEGEGTLLCCQCRTVNDVICACRVNSSYQNNTTCTTYCRTLPPCGASASGAVTGYYCGAGNVCKEMP
jgi:hypothetical protein